MLALWLSHSARSDQLLVAPQGAVAAGDEITIQLLITNDTGSTQQVDIADELPVRLIAQRRARNLVLMRQPEPAGEKLELPPQGFGRITYRIRLPFDFTGPVTLRGSDGSIAPVMFSIGEGQAAQPQAGTDDEATSRPAATDRVAPLSRESAFLAAFSAYEPVYFALGPREDWNAKFQVSFKFRFFNEEASLAQRFHVLEHLYLGYTQTSLWDLASPSAPFRDTSYKPRLFYSDPESWHARGFPLRVGLESGLGHESNGRSGAESRSINIAYVRPTLVLGAPGSWQWTFSPVFYDYLDTADNRDISDYRGYVDLYGSVSKADSWQLAALLRKGEGQRWTTQIDLTYPLGGVALGNLNGYVLFQFFDGWGESILDYNQRQAVQYRIGLMFVR